MEHLLLCFQADTDNRISLATRTLYSYLKPRVDQTQTKISLIDFRTEETPEDMKDKILETNADIIGLSCYLWSFKNFFKLANLLKKGNPGLTILTGGPQMSLDKEDMDRVFKEYPSIDLVIQEEGEKSLLKYLNTPKDKRPPVNSVIQGEPLEDLRDIGSPIFEDFPPFWKEDREFPIELSRRCVGLCSYCVQAGKMKYVQHHRGLAQVEDELIWAKNYGVPGINFSDAHVNVNSLNVKDLIDKIIEVGMGDLEHHFQMMYNMLKEEDVEQFGRVNAFTNLGLQSTNPYVNKLCKRALNLTRFERAVALFKKYKINMQGHLILGLPGDTVEGFKNSIQYAKNLGIDIFDIFILRVLPGTSFYYDRHNLQLEYDPDTFMVRKTNTMSESDLLSCVEIANELAPDNWELFDKYYQGVKLKDNKIKVPYVPDEEREDIDPPDKITKGLPEVPPLDKNQIRPLLLAAKRIFDQLPMSENVNYSTKYFNGEWSVICKVILDRGDVCLFAFLSADSQQNGLLETENFKLLYLADQSSDNSNSRAYLRLLERKFANKK